MHQIESDRKVQGVFISDSLAYGQSFTFTFTQPGTYTYHCAYHPTMKGEHYCKTMTILSISVPNSASFTIDNLIFGLSHA